MNKSSAVTALLLFGPFLFLTLTILHRRNTFIASLTMNDIQSFRQGSIDCKSYGFKPLSSNSTNISPPIYDYILFNDEFDTLEIRLYEMYNYVTLFLIAESGQTMTGKDKQLYLKENWSKYIKYHDKMRRVEVHLDKNPKSAWDNEKRMRNEGLQLALQNLSQNFLLLVSDVDEIPKIRFLRSLSECQLPDRFVPLVLECDFYYYSFEFRHKRRTWNGTTVIHSSLYTDSNRTQLLSAQNMRFERDNYWHIPSGCYHCTWCFDRLETVRSKMAAYSHTEHNTVRFRAREHILDRYRYGKDLFDRPKEEYVYRMNNSEIPSLLKRQPERFAYMTKRFNLSNAGFLDVQ